MSSTLNRKLSVSSTDTSISQPNQLSRHPAYYVLKFDDLRLGHPVRVWNGPFGVEFLVRMRYPITAVLLNEHIA